jgi:hypothetical protein
MKTRLHILLFAFSILYLNAQQIEHYPETFRNFTLKYSSHSIHNSLYNIISLIDLRKDTLRLGQCQFGFLNKTMTLTPKPLLSTQLSNILTKTIDQSSKPGVLTLFLKKFLLSGLSPEGSCIFKADLYRKTDSGYYFVQSIDTVVFISKMSVTKATINLGDSLFCNFIIHNLLNAGNLNKSFTYEEALSADSIAKHKLRLYNTNTFVDGIYNSYGSFKNQIPDKIGSIIRKNGKIKSVKVIDENGVKQDVDHQTIYAVVTDGLPFISNEYGYYPLVQRDNDFVFIGEFRDSAKTGKVVAAAMVFGYVGALAALQSEYQTFYYCELNYKNGDFIKVSETPIEINTSSSVYNYNNASGTWNVKHQ